MSTAEKIYEHVKGLPEPVALEILDFVEFVQKKKTMHAGDTKATASPWPAIVQDYRGESDFPPFETGRDRLCSASDDPLS